MRKTKGRFRSKDSYPKETKQTSELSLFITNSPEMNELLEKVRKFARSEASVLITGESGVGKEIIANYIHAYSPRKDEAFVPVNSCAIPPDLVESELFGYEKGAFTGATSSKEGCFEQANYGTLFLDEIGDMPKALQVKVLRAVEMNSFRRVGGKKEISVDVRIVSATNKVLLEKVEDNSFREDLYHRINVLELYIPPLRRRKKDIPVLIEHFSDVFKNKYNCSDSYFSEECIEIMKQYRWPGNVRELKNIVERCMIASSPDKIEPSVLPDRFFKKEETSQTENGGNFFKIPMGSTMQEIEQTAILKTLAAVDNNKTEAARILGLTRKTLRSKI